MMLEPTATAGGSLDAAASPVAIASPAAAQPAAAQPAAELNGPSRWPTAAAAVVLVLLVVAVFHPLPSLEFVDFDTNSHVVRNPHIRGLTWENVRHILTTRCVTSYYPVRSLSYALDYQLWGLNPAGFKLTNGLFHLANVLLLYGLILRLLRHPAVAERSSAKLLPVAAALFSAAVFAVHPVVVEPVAWVPGREELLMTLGALGSMHFYLAADRLGGPGQRGRRRAAMLGAVLCCAAAGLSNAVGAVIPLLITAWDALVLPRPKLWRIVRRTWPLWAIGAATVLIKGRYVPAEATGTLPSVLSLEWLLMIVSVYGLNLRSLVWPAELGILYEWIPSYGFRGSELLAGGIALLATPVLLWWLRRRTLILFGLVWFLLALGPTAQIMPHHIARADRFLYLPLAGLAIATAAAVVLSAGVWRGWGSRLAGAGLAAAVLLLAGMLSAAQLQTWQNSFTMWQNCLRVSPQNPMAHRCFAELLAKRGQFAAAMPHYHMALRVEPDSVPTLHSFALRLATCEPELRDYRLAIQLAERGCQLTGWKDPELRRTLAAAHASWAGDLHGRGEHVAAVEHYRRAIEADAAYDVAWLNLAILLATCSDRELRRPEEAVQLAERGCELAGQPGPARLRILAAAYAAAGRGELAIGTAARAVALAEGEDNPVLAEQLRAQLAAYQAGRLEHELP